VLFMSAIIGLKDQSLEKLLTDFLSGSVLRHSFGVRAARVGGRPRTAWGLALTTSTGPGPFPRWDPVRSVLFCIDLEGD
jgi:hypothetical protein